MVLRIKILIVDDDTGHLATLKTITRSWGYDPVGVENGQDAVEAVKQAPFSLILMDIRMAKMSGMEALKIIHAYNPAIPILIMTAYSSVETAIDALKSGAYDYLTKPLDFEALKHTLTRAIDHAGLKAENRTLKHQLAKTPSYLQMVGESKAMKALGEVMAMVAPTDATVMINGESGTGKELVAKSLHDLSARKSGPMVTVNCAALTETLLESELFGHEKGAFTGADKQREGRFKQADTGSIFLDEIGETSPAMQAKLLRVIQEREVQRVGGDTSFHVDVRIITASHKDLKAAVQNGSFREDLYYRLNVMTLHVPPLREREDDVPRLAQFFAQKFQKKNHKTVRGFSPAAMDMLVRYDWPGNVRELENAIERAVILMTGEYITEKQLPLTVQHAYPSDAAEPPSKSRNLANQPLEAIEKEAILSTLSATGGNKSETARRLGINRKTLHKKLQAYGMDTPSS